MFVWQIVTCLSEGWAPPLWISYRGSGRVRTADVNENPTRKGAVEYDITSADVGMLANANELAADLEPYFSGKFPMWISLHACRPTPTICIRSNNSHKTPDPKQVMLCKHYWQLFFKITQVNWLQMEHWWIHSLNPACCTMQNNCHKNHHGLERMSTIGHTDPTLVHERDGWVVMDCIFQGVAFPKGTGFFAVNFMACSHKWMSAVSLPVLGLQMRIERPSLESQGRAPVWWFHPLSIYQRKAS